MLQGIVVGLIVVAAALYITWTMMPASLRLRLGRSLGAWGRSKGKPASLARVMAAIERAAQARAGGCHDCAVTHEPTASGKAARPLDTDSRRRKP